MQHAVSRVSNLTLQTVSTLRILESVPAIGNLWRIEAFMASVQGRDQLRKYTPDETFGRSLVILLIAFDHLTQVAIPAILHVQMQILGVLKVVSLKVLDNVRVFKFF